MTQSESIKELSTALVAFHKEVGKVKKDSTNPFFHSKYASLSNILDAIEEPLGNSGLSILQLPSGDDSLTTMLIHQSGEFISSESAIHAKSHNDPQAVGSAITYARRYAISALLALNEDDDDAESTRKPVAIKQVPLAPREQEQNPFDETAPAGNVREVTITDIQEGTTAKGQPFMKVQTNIGPMSLFDKDLFDYLTLGGANLALEKNGNYTNIIGIN